MLRSRSIIPLKILVLFSSSNLNKLLAQEYEYYPSAEVKTIITASADNYFPNLNEPVTLKLKAKCARNSKAGQFVVGFSK